MRHGFVARGGVVVGRRTLVEDVRGDRATGQDADGEDAGGDLCAEAAAGQHGGSTFAYAALADCRGVDPEAVQ